MNAIPKELLVACNHLRTGILTELKNEFVSKDEVIDLLGVSLVGGENLFILGPPGTAKSAIVHRLCQRLQGNTFIYLLTRFTEPNELFGPFDIRRLREGELTTNTAGMLSEASLVFLDELLNANSAILNSLLTALNERAIHRGHEHIPVEALLFVGASNHLPQEDALQALFDRFLLRVHCDNVPADQLTQLLEAGWNFERSKAVTATVTFADIREFQKLLPYVSLDDVRMDYADLIRRIRQAGIRVSDRRAVKLQRVIAASALLCGRAEANASDLWVLRYIWDTQEQQELLKALVQDSVDRAAVPDSAPDDSSHEQASSNPAPDPERVAADLEWIEQQLGSTAQTAVSLGLLRDRLATLSTRLAWMQNPEQRQYLEQRIDRLWQALEATNTPTSAAPTK